MITIKILKKLSINFTNKITSRKKYTDAVLGNCVYADISEDKKFTVIDRYSKEYYTSYDSIDIRRLNKSDKKKLHTSYNFFARNSIISTTNVPYGIILGNITSADLLCKHNDDMKTYYYIIEFLNFKAIKYGMEIFKNIVLIDKECDHN